MFCQKCGKQNSGDAVFCENCGADLRDHPAQGKQETQGVPLPAQGNMRRQAMQESQMAQVPPRKPFPKLLAVAAAEVVILVSLALAWSQSRSPEKAAERYFVNFVNGDWEAVRSQLGFKSDWLSSESFARVQAGNNLGIVENYQIRKEDQETDRSVAEAILGYTRQPDRRRQNEEEELWKEVVIDYQAQGEMRTYTVPLQKVEGEWIINSDFVCHDYCVYVPEGAKAWIDGIDLEKAHMLTEEDEAYYGGMNGYEIYNIFYGFYDIKVSMEGMEDFTETIWIEPGDSQYCLEHMSPEKETLDELIEQSRTNMQQIYSAALEGKNFAAIEELFVAEEETKRGIQESYDKLLSQIHEGSIQIENVSFHDILGEISPESSAVSLEFEYEMQYLEEDWWSGDMERDTESGSGSWQFYFVKEDGKWVQQNLGCEKLY